MNIQSIRGIIKKLNRVRVINTLYITLNVIKALVSSAYPFINIIIPKLIIDELLSGRDIGRLALLVAFIIGVNLIFKIFISFIDAIMQKQAAEMNRQYDFLISETSMGLPYERLEKDDMIQQIKLIKEGRNRSGGVASLVDSFFMIFSKIITTIGIIGLILSLDFWLILIAVITIIINTWVQSKLKKHDIEFFNVLLKHNIKFMYLSGVILNKRYAKDIRLYEANQTFTSKMDEFAMNVDGWFKKIGRKKIKYSVFSHFMDGICQVMVYGYLAFQFLGGFVTLGLFTMYISSVTTFTNTIVDGMKILLDIYEKYKWLKPSIDFIDYQTEINNEHENHILGNVKNPVIEFKNVSYRYENSEIYALKNVSLTIPYGQKLSVVGMNGAGKTTLIKLLLRLYTPTDGKIYLDGKNINDYPIEAYYKLFSVVFQDFKLLAATIKDNIICDNPISQHDESLKSSLIKSGIYDRIEKMPLGYVTHLYKLFYPEGINLSGGEEQRLAISRALYKNAPVAVLDEPTSALDPKTEYEIYTGMDKLVENKTSIYISHRMTSCIFCDKVAVFHEGKLIQYGTHKELIKQDDKYALMFNKQAQNYLTEL